MFEETTGAARGRDQLTAAVLERSAEQQPDWPDTAPLEAARATLRAQPPLVFAGECDLLTERLAAVSRGEAFLLQGGDCAETFEAVSADNVRNKLKTLLQMSVVLTYAAAMPVVKVGRLAGQYAKPRSQPTETRDDVTLPAFRGDIVNGFPFTEQSRRPDPERLVRAYHASAATLNLTRAFVGGGYADLRQTHAWNTDFVRTSAAGQRYERLASRIDKALSFMAAIGADSEQLRTVELYASHEALLLDYELPLTRVDSRTGLPYDVSGHLMWIGERTRQRDGAHIEFASRIRNPVGVKIGPGTTPDELAALSEKLDPHRVPGRLTFITRMGAGQVRERLPALLQAAAREGLVASWICDPMHGNTYGASTGHKTRRFDDVVDEVRGFFEVHHAMGSHPGGLHVELTGDDVTECVGGGEPIAEDRLAHRYETVCDPRLNRSQSLELAFLVAELLEDGTGVA